MENGVLITGPFSPLNFEVFCREPDRKVPAEHDRMWKMRSMFDTPTEYREAILEIARNKTRYSNTRPERFIRMMETHHGTTDEQDEHLLHRKNPLVLALGDSVTAGWFEGNTLFPENIKRKYFYNRPGIDHVTDIEHVYHEQFKLMLADKYERTSLSVINSGISGDTPIGIYKRLYRDCIRYHPDLVIYNASLNGPEDLVVFEDTTRKIMERIMADTRAEIIIVTPNLMHPELMGTLEERVRILKNIAAEYDLCVADVYSLWKQIQSEGYDFSILLANELNHPTCFAHTLYAMELMKLFE